MKINDVIVLICIGHHDPGTCYLQFDSGATIPNLGGSQVADSERLLDIGVSCESSPGPTGGGLTMNEVG